MKRELPQWLLWVAIAVGAAILGFVIFRAVGPARPSADEQKVIEMQTEAARERSMGYATGNGVPGGQAQGQPGQGTSEFSAREQSQQGN